MRPFDPAGSRVAVELPIRTAVTKESLDLARGPGPSLLGEEAQSNTTDPPGKSRSKKALAATRNGRAADAFAADATAALCDDGL